MSTAVDHAPQGADPGSPHTAYAPVVVEGLVKRFGTFAALDGLDLRVESGRVHGFLGPNGAGKSTTIRTLLGLYRADAGTVRVLGRDPRTSSAAINTKVGYVPGDVGFWPSLTGGQVLDALAGLRGARDRGREADLLERFALDPTRKVRTYSKGNRQKVARVAALSAPVDLLLLDEPTSGLDPLMEEVFADCVTEAAASGQTVLLSSHVLAEVERLCSHVTILKDGRTVESGALADLRSVSASSVSFRCAATPGAEMVQQLRGLGLAPGVADGAQGEVRVSAQVPRKSVPDVLALLAQHRVADVSCTPATLEDLFLRHYETRPR
jgi:ABC-2 type transport system ATP-binding protein